MYETLKRLYLTDRLTGDCLTKAAEKGWITRQQAEDIKGN